MPTLHMDYSGHNALGMFSLVWFPIKLRKTRFWRSSNFLYNSEVLSLGKGKETCLKVMFKFFPLVSRYLLRPE